MFQLLSACLLLALAAPGALAQGQRPYAIKVFTEPGAEAAAQTFIKELSELEPFRQLIRARALSVSSEPELATELNCRGGNFGIERLAQCQTASIVRRCGQADLCPIFTNVPWIGAGGKPYPIASSSFPWTTMLHELVHTFGFSDEYAYTPSETRTYCRSSTRNPNEISLSVRNVFRTEALALEACQRHVPWCREAIAAGTQVVQRGADGSFRVGSPPPQACPSTQLGVYPGAGCQRKHPEFTFRPYFCPTVMGYPDLGQEFCEVQERHALIARLPELLPPLYQRILFGRIAARAGRKDLVFELVPRPPVENFSYSIPSVDALPGGNTELGKTCRGH